MKSIIALIALLCFLGSCARSTCPANSGYKASQSTDPGYKQAIKSLADQNYSTSVKK